MAIDNIIQRVIAASHSIGNIYLAVVIILITTVLIWLIRSTKSGDTVLLLGLSNSGKTLLYVLLTTQKFMSTQTSIQENKGKCHIEKGKVKKIWNLIDLPGHERVLSQYLHKHKDSARGVVFVVDSVQFPREIRDVAQLMYDILANRTIQKNKISMLVACNKQDLPTAKSCHVIRKQLEKELNNLRLTRSAALPGIEGSSASKNAFIGKVGKDFEFSHVYPIKVEFCECNLRGENEDQNTEIRELEAWFLKL